MRDDSTPTIDKQCEYCGASFSRRPGQTKQNFTNKRTCSVKCEKELFFLAHQKRNASSDNPDTRALLLPRTCRSCGELFERRRNEQSSHFQRRHTCSRECKTADNARSLREFSLNGKPSTSNLRFRPATPIAPKFCLSCGVEFLIRENESRSEFTRRETCSVDCGKRLMGDRKREKARAGIGSKICTVCNDEFTIREDEHLSKFRIRKTCSAECAGEQIGRTRKSGGVGRIDTYPPEWTGKLRAEIRARDGNRCAFCGNDWFLSVHHINYNKHDCAPSNLLTLCGNCHSKTTNGDRSDWYFKCMAILVERGIVDLEDIAA